LGGGTEVGTYKVEGIGYDFFPDVLDRDLVDVWVKTTDGPSFQLARRLIREDGLLCGGSSGSAMFAVLKEAPRLSKGQNCVVILPDGVRNYMTKFVDDKWMRDNRFSGTDAREGTVRLLTQSRPSRSLFVVEPANTAQHAITVMREQGISQVPVVEGGKLVGLLTEEGVLQVLASGQTTATATVGQLMDRSVPQVELGTPLATLQEMLLNSGRAIVVDSDRRPVSIVTKIDLVEFLMATQGAQPGAAR
jgi:cystathionine beta-synthase